MATINSKISEKIRAQAGKLLEEKKVAAFLGYCQGSLPMTARPFVARTPEDTDKLIWNSFCVLNLANYLPELLKSLEPPRGPRDPAPEGPLPKVAILATGCWSRNIVIQIQENQVDRDRVVICGVGSRGMVAQAKVKKLFDGREILEVKEEDHKLLVSGNNFNEEINRWNVVRDNCLTCIHPDPVIFDIRIGDEAGQRKNDNPFIEVEKIENKSTAERSQWFTDEFSSCIRCYACRNACPLCYCPTCFVDDAKPQWVGKSVDQVDTSIFHILRAYHCAGRCTDCGSCESVCPMGINMRILTRKLSSDVLKLYGSEAGMALDSPLPLTTYQQDDPQNFIITEQAADKEGE